MTAGGGPAVLETARLVLREMDQGDLDFVASLLADLEVMRFYPRVQTRDEAVAWIERQRGRYAADGHGLWLAADKVSGAQVGQAGLAIQTVDGVPETEIGYMIAPRHWRRGLATEAATACRDHALGRLGRRRVVCLVRPENMPSQGVARKLGMSVARTTVFAGFPHLVFATGLAGAEK